MAVTGELRPGVEYFAWQITMCRLSVSALAFAPNSVREHPPRRERSNIPLWAR